MQGILPTVLGISAFMASFLNFETGIYLSSHFTWLVVGCFDIQQQSPVHLVWQNATTSALFYVTRADSHSCIYPRHD